MTEQHDSTKATVEHIAKVRERINEIRYQLANRALDHDASKLREPEKSGWDTLAHQLGTLKYGSDEYKAALAAGRSTIELHYAANSHHPECHKNGIAGMTLIDLVEMFCDWKAASERTLDGSLRQSLPVNKERWQISDQLYAILENTARELGWE